MAKQDKGNMFGSFAKSVAEREQEQRAIEAAVTGKAAPEPAAKSVMKTPGVGRPRKRVDATSMTICISQADKELVKAYALAHAVTVSDLIHKWIQETCDE